MFINFIKLLFSCQIVLGNSILEVEIADTEEKRAKGLMNHPPLKDGDGMLFIFSHPQIASFWMKGVEEPLSIAFFDEEKVLVEMVDMPICKKGEHSPPIYQSSTPILYALEVPLHWFYKKKVKKGAKFTFLDSQNCVE